MLTKDIELQLKRLSLEANFSTNVIEIFHNLLPDLKSKIEETRAHLLSDSKNSVVNSNLLPEYKELEKKITHYSYLDYVKTAVSVPEGFRGNLLAYITELNELLVVMYNEAQESLLDEHTRLAYFISNKEAKFQLSDPIPSRAGLDAEVVKGRLSVYFPASAPIAKVYLGTTIANFAELEPLAIKSTALAKCLSGQNMVKLTNDIHTVTSLIDIIVKTITDGQISNLGGVVSSRIGESIYKVARIVELFSVVRFKAEGGLKASEDLLRHLNKIM